MVAGGRFGGFHGDRGPAGAPPGILHLVVGDAEEPRQRCAGARVLPGALPGGDHRLLADIGGGVAVAHPRPAAAIDPVGAPIVEGGEGLLVAGNGKRGRVVRPLCVCLKG